MSSNFLLTKGNPASHYQSRRQKTSASKDGGGKTRGRRTTYSTVVCKIHGKMPNGSGYTLPELRCPQPRNKRERFGGCPLCSMEKNKKE